MVPQHQKFVGYYRVSTRRQGASGLGLEAQQTTVRQYLVQVGGVELEAFIEVESGKNAINRPQLQAALQRCKQTRATLLVAKLDRLSRNAAFLLNLKEAGVEFRALDIPDANTLTLGIMATLAQHERELISKRTREALAARRARGQQLGTPRDMSAYAKRASRIAGQVNHAKALGRAQEVAPAIAEAREAGCESLRTIAAYLNEREITTPRGKAWTPTAVANAVRLIEAA